MWWRKHMPSQCNRMKGRDLQSSSDHNAPSWHGAETNAVNCFCSAPQMLLSCSGCKNGPYKGGWRSLQSKLQSLRPASQPFGARWGVPVTYSIAEMLQFGLLLFFWWLLRDTLYSISFPEGCTSGDDRFHLSSLKLGSTYSQDEKSPPAELEVSYKYETFH